MGHANIKNSSLHKLMPLNVYKESIDVNFARYFVPLRRFVTMDLIKNVNNQQILKLA